MDIILQTPIIVYFFSYIYNLRLPAKKNNIAELSDNARSVLKSRYLRSGEHGMPDETPHQMFQRVAKAVAQAELSWSTVDQSEVWERRFLETMEQLDFLPNSPTLMNAGTPLPQLSACFVLPIADHLEDIFSSLKLAALIQQSGGGTGFNFSQLRPKDDALKHSQGTASGPVSFMKIFDAATENVKQGGKRRGANMGILNIDHPDVEEFITCKRIEGNLRNFNISIGVSDAFMYALQQGDDWKLIHPNSHQTVRTVKAKDLWHLIAENAWTSGDPGVIFLDTINASNPTPAIGKIDSTNPCGEVPLLPYESCNLGSINLSRFVQFKGVHNRSLDWQALAQTIAIATRFLDNVITVNHYLSPEIKEMAEGNRKIGLGVMGWAESLSMLEIPYESAEAVQLAERLMKFISQKSLETSVGLSKERGTFKYWKKSIYYPDVPVRNATRTSIAPTGTISIIAGTSSSIEPFFALAYQRMHVLQDETLQEINRSLLRFLSANKLETKDILSAIMQTGTLENLAGVPRRVKNIFKTALEIQPSWHLKHQVAFQKFTDNAVSKTINLNREASREDVDLIYRSAWQEKLKGITIFRNNTRKNQVLQQGIKRNMTGCKVCIA